MAGVELAAGCADELCTELVSGTGVCTVPEPGTSVGMGPESGTGVGTIFLRGCNTYTVTTRVSEEVQGL